MKILFVAPRFHTNQVEIVRTLLERGHDVRFHVAVEGPTEDHRLLMPTVIPESRLSALLRRSLGDGGVNRKRYFPGPLAYASAVREFRPDVVVIRVHGLAFSVIAAAAARLAGARVVFYTQRPSAFLDRYGWREMLKYEPPLRLFDAAWMTPLRSPHHRHRRLPARFHYVPFAVPVRAELDRRDDGSRPLRLLLVGKFVPRKNHLLMVDAVARLASRRQLHVTLAGEVATDEHREHLQRVKGRIASRGVGHLVRILTNVPFPQIGALYREHDVMVLPARDEPASIAVLEAMGQGLPVICTESCGTRTYVDHGVHGYVIPPDDLDALAEALGRFLEDPHLAETMGRAAWERAEEEISADAFYDRFLALIDDVLDGRG